MGAYANHREEMDAALGELVGDPRGVLFGDTDVQLAASWQLGDRELPGGGTPAQRYARPDRGRRWARGREGILISKGVYAR